MSRTRHLHPVFFALAGFTFWVLSDAAVKLAGQNDMPPYEIVGFLGFFAALPLLLFYAPQGKIRELWPKKPRRQMARVLMSCGCVTANALALKHMPLTVFYVVAFTAPILIALLAAAFLREHLGLAKILAVLAGFAGVVIAVAPWGGIGQGDWIGYAAAGFAACFFSVGAVLLRLTAQNETPQSLVFCMAVAETVLGFGLTLFHAVPVTMKLLPVLAAMGALSAVGNVFNCLALKYAPAATVEQFHYSQIVVGALIGYLVWHEVPTLHMLAGAAIIILSGVYVVASVHRAGKPRLPTDI